MFPQVVFVELVSLDRCPPLLPAISARALADRMYVSVLGGTPVTGSSCAANGAIICAGCFSGHYPTGTSCTACTRTSDHGCSACKVSCPSGQFMTGSCSSSGEQAQKKAKAERMFLFSSESVNEGHPDKVRDQVPDAVLDARPAADPKRRLLARRQQRTTW